MSKRPGSRLVAIMGSLMHTVATLARGIDIPQACVHPLTENNEPSYVLIIPIAFPAFIIA